MKFKMIPTAFVSALVVALAIASAVLYAHSAGVKKGKQTARLEPLQKARAAAVVRTREDSIRSDSAMRVANNVHTRSEATHAQAVSANDRYLETRRQLASVPDSVLAGFPTLAVAAIETRDSALVRADIAVAALRDDTNGARTEVSALRAVTSADSIEKSGLKLQLARTDSAAEILSEETHPRCGVKCGISLGGGIVALFTYLVRR